MKEHYVSYDCAVKLKELGFNWEACGKYVDCPNDPTLFSGMIRQPWNLKPDEIIAPTLAQAAEWLREVKKLEVNAYWQFDESKWHSLCNDMSQADPMGVDLALLELEFDSYESALSAGISKALELLGKEDKE